MKLSVGTQLAIVTVSVLLVVTSALVVGLASEERQRAIEGKQAAATMLTELFAASVSAGVVFADDDAVKAVLENLRHTEDVVGGAVFAPSSGTPAGSFGEVPPPNATPGVELEGSRLVVTRAILDNDGNVVGWARVAFSLARENATVARTERDLAIGGAIVMVVTAALLIGLARQRVVQPLMTLVAAAKQIERGDLTERAPERGDAEIATLARAFNNMGEAIAERERQLKAELQVAADLQISILPKDTQVEGVEMSAMMKPATEVGGDYYDIIPTQDGCWLGIGDVSGHGLGAGVIMLMIQSAVSALVAAKPNVSPVEVECAVNRVLYENIRQRMGRRDHATLSILRYRNDGTVRFAGAHEELIVYRAATETVETFETPGTWVGAKKDVSSATTESMLALGPGDVLVLYTDGVTEAMRDGVQFGFDRLLETVRCAAKGSASSVRDAVTSAVSAWTAAPADDVSVVVLRQLARAEDVALAGR